MGIVNRYVCCLDLGTTGSKAALCDVRGRIVHRVSAPACGGIEFDAEETARVAMKLVAELVAKSGIAPAEVGAVSLSSQRASVVPVDAAGAPTGAAISWQDTRCGDQAATLGHRVGEERFQRITGLPVSFLWTVSKLAWLRDAMAEQFERSARFVLLPDFVLARLGAGGFVCDLSNASLTGLLDIGRRDWSGEVLEAAGLSPARLPDLVPPGTKVGSLNGTAARATGLLEGTPLVSGGGDQQCAALGLGAVDPGSAGLCLGTAAIVSCPTLAPRVIKNVFCTVHCVPERYVMEGIHNSFGSALAWAAKVLGAKDVAEIEAAATQASSDGIVFVPHLAGAGSPDFDASACGAFTGLKLCHERGALARAAFEGVVLETRRIIETMERGGPIENIHVCGGAARGTLLARLLADVTGKELRVSEEPDASLVGAALLAWSGLGVYEDPGCAARGATDRPGESVLTPAPDRSAADALYARYLAAVDAARVARTGTAE